MDAVASTTRNKKKVSTCCSSHIPDDLSFSILSKLPLKSLTRFTCAQKSWSLLLQNPNFMDMFRTNFFTSNNNHHDDECLLLIQNTRRIPFHHSPYIISGESFEDRVKLEWPLPFQENDESVHIFGSASVNGILCLFDYNIETIIVLWNPATDEFKTIPPSYEPYENTVCNYKPCGFGYDCIRDDYKVIRIVPCSKFFEGNWILLPDSHLWESDELLDMELDDDEFWEGFEIDMYDDFWEIYSLKSNSWRKLDGADLPDSWGCDFYNVNLNGYCHWFDYRNHMVSFDFTNDMFLSTTLPSDSDLQMIRQKTQLFELNRSVSLICDYNVPDYSQIWILGELGVKKSWTKLFVVGPLTCSIMRPIGAGSHIFFRKIGDSFACYDFDFRTQRISKIEAKGEFRVSQIVKYKENLVPFGGMIN